MGIYRGPRIIEEGLKLALDPLALRSYPGSGTEYTDIVTKIKGSLANTPRYSTEQGGYFSFNKSASRVILGQTYGSAGWNTISVWHKVDNSDATTSWRTIVGHATGNIHHMISDSSGVRNLGIFDGGARLSTYVLPDDNKFHNYTFVYQESTNAAIYVDGIYHSTIPTTLNFVTNPFRLIGNWGGHGYWAGPIGSVHYWDRELLASEILYNYKQLKERYK